MNRVQFQKWLEQFPEDTIIVVGVQQEAPTYHAYGKVMFEKFNAEEQYDHWELLDFPKNQFVKEADNHYGKVYLQLGSSI